MKVYVASSWKNMAYPHVVAALRARGHEVYDFRDANRAFNWSEAVPGADPWDPVLSVGELMTAYHSKPANVAFAHDKGALDWAEAGVMVMPCGRSAHLEAGYLIGQGKPVCILLAANERPDLMHRLAVVCESMQEVHAALAPFALEEVRAA